MVIARVAFEEEEFIIALWDSLLRGLEVGRRVPMNAFSEVVVDNPDLQPVCRFDCLM